MARQQERARRTRAAIIRSAAVEFGKSGYAAASLNRILEGSRATKGAMYFHFDSKEDLARAVLDTALDRYRFSADRWLARTDLGPLDVMHGMLDEIALRLEHDIIVQAEFRLIIEPDFYREVPNGGGRIIARATRALAVRAIEQGQLRADADPDRFARTLAAPGGGGGRGAARTRPGTAPTAALCRELVVDPADHHHHQRARTRCAARGSHHAGQCLPRRGRRHQP
ncbi:TetR/AcrR family transcriptional regulator, partial [Nocardia cyriacigeorgica]|uniref:TetR/AcrR family transcriptional regulator n=1 Tax=Nocardia cyriacigeorgica TaxID=135487 RepID=UPI0024564D47